MRWICILVATCIFLRMYSSIGVFLHVFVEIIKFEKNSNGRFNFSKKDSANRHALKTKFIFNSSLLFSKGKFSEKKSVLNIIIAKFYVYGL